MNKKRGDWVGIIGVLLLIYLCPNLLTAQNDIIHVPGSTQKIEQLVGDYDNQLRKLTTNLTNQRYGVANTDLGVPFEHKGRTYVAFGDIFHDDRDPLAYTTDTDPENGITLTFNTKEDGTFQPIEIPGVNLGGFGVPIDGISWNDNMYLYASNAGMVNTVLAKSTDDGHTFTKLYDFSNSKFINVSLVKTKTKSITEYPEPLDTDIQVMFGSGQYRESHVYLAYQRGDKIEERAVNFFAGLINGRPQWSPYEAAAAPLFNQPCVGELSVSYNEFIEKWVMLYNCGQPRGINCRTSDNPWGPWSDPFVIFEPWDDGGYCQFIHSNWDFGQCDNVHDPGREYEWGGEYGPYQFKSMAKGNNYRTTIYYTLSTWNPYTVVLMKSTLENINGIPTGVANNGNSTADLFNLYPNPATDKFKVEFIHKQGDTGLIVFHDVQGRQLKEETIMVNAGENKYELFVQDLPAGLYFLKIKLLKSSQIITKKVMLLD